MPAINGMGDGAQLGMASFRVAEFSEVLDWRPMLFQEPIIAQRACVLCGVVYKKAVRLPCVHTLCTKCHARCVDKGSMCPVDQEQFCEDDVEQLDVSLKYLLNRRVACWNASSGCSFVGPAASLLDHYKECDFNVVPCCLCHSSVLQSNILEHLKSDCSIRQATGEPTNSPATQDLEDVSRACLEMKEAIGKISEDLLSLQISLNQCSEDVRVEGARCKALLEAENSRLTEQLKDHSTVCTARVTKAMQVVVQAATTDYKEHVSNELRLLSHCRPKKVHWYIEGWADITKQVSESGYKSLDGPNSNMYGYSVSQCVDLKQKGDNVRVGCFLQIHYGGQDFQLEWPFSKVFTVGFIHPKNQSKVISVRENPGECEDGDEECFLRPKGHKTHPYGAVTLSTADKLETDGFIESDTLHAFLEIEL